MDKIYLDTSALIAAANKNDEYHNDAILFFSLNQKSKIYLYYSDLTITELKRNRKKFDPLIMELLLNNEKLNFKIIEFHKHIKLYQEIANISMYYENPVPNYHSSKNQDDALHLATASIAQIPILLSTNFKDITKPNIAMDIHKGNQKAGYNHYLQTIDFQEYNQYLSQDKIDVIFKPNFNLEKFNSKYKIATKKIKISKKYINIALKSYELLNLKNTLTNCLQALKFIIEADACLKNNLEKPFNTLVKEIKSNFMEKDLKTNNQFFDFYQTLKETTKNFKKIPLQEMEVKIINCLIETNHWVNIYINYQEMLSIKHSEKVYQSNKELKKRLNQKNLPLINTSPQKP